MASASVAHTIRAPGRIVIGPAQSLLDGAYPFGGAEIGRSSVCRATPLGQTFAVNCEALGEPTDILETVNRYVFACFLHGFDADAVSRLVHGTTTTGTYTRHPMLTLPGDRVAGMSLLDRAVTLLYVPDDTVRVPALIAYRAVPRWDDGAEVMLQRGQELGFALAFDCLRNDDGVSLRMGHLEDLPIQ